jgi:hypothetical protein
MEAEANSDSLATKTQRDYASAEEWAAQRATITRLYQDERRTLRAVMDIMKDQYNFRATYKTRPASVTTRC